jgi:hypothetical protein
VSIAVQPTTPVRSWSPEQRKAIERKALEILRGVGDTSAEHWQMGSLALHYRRPMTLAEALRLSDPIPLTPAEKRRVTQRMYALEAAGVINEADIQETQRSSDR